MKRSRTLNSISVIAGLVLGAWVAASGANAAAARLGGPSKAQIEQLIESYSGGENPTMRFQFSDIRVAPPRVLHEYEVYGLAGGTRAWLAMARYSVFSAAGDIASSSSTCEKTDNVAYYYIYKDAFGKWAEYATAHPGSVTRNAYHGACPNMPGVGIFSTPMPSAP